LSTAVASSVRRATAVVALSEYTKTEIAELLGRRSGVHVIYGAGNYPAPADTVPAPGDAGILGGLGVTRPYVLYVGDFNPRKNVPYLVRSFAALRKKAPQLDVQLVLAGQSAEVRDSLIQQATDAGLSQHDVVLPGRVSNADLAVLYRNAGVFALCSLMEGFTLVTLEAMSYGVPVVATRTSSIAEGTGDAAELVPLDSPKVTAAALQLALLPGPRRDEMRKRGLIRAQQFTWERTAHQTLSLYAAVAGARPLEDRLQRPAAVSHHHCV
jgi:glycosyltransferase involved in cell wall biosynthesis